MKRKYSLFVVLVLSVAAAAWAATPPGIQGRVRDAAGAAVSGAGVTITDVGTNEVSHASSGVSGQFTAPAVAGHQYRVEVTKAGFATFETQVAAAASAMTPVDARLQLTTMVQSVMVRSGAVPGATLTPTPVQVFQSMQTTRVLDREQINALSPVAGAAQILSIAPGTNVTGFGNTGATKSTITLNGIQQGWGGYGGFTTAGDVGITFDGIPVSDGATGLWQSNMFPQSALINSTSVTYGPGDPATRSNNNVGGGVEFTPLQPASHPHGSISETLGSYGQENTSFELTSGEKAGWAAVVAGGYGTGDSFRQASDGFKNPNRDYAAYGKAIKAFSLGDFELGGYYSFAQAYRPQVIPVAQQADITIDGTPAGTPYSQQTSGFYSTVPFAAYHKHDSNQMALFWSKLHVALDPDTSLQNSIWYERINRLHDRTADIFAQGAQEYEWNNPFTKTYGDKLSVQRVFSYNTVTAGLSYMHTLYNSHNNFYNPADGGSSNGVANIGGKIRSSYFNQDQYGVFIQDQIRPGVTWFSFTPGIRYFNTNIVYTDGTLNDFTFAPGATPHLVCTLNGASYTVQSGNVKVQSNGCDAAETRGGYEPSIDMSIQPAKWINLYGGFQESLRTPAVGGGGGMFQNVDPASYQLARAEYSQAGFKMHFNQAGSVNNLLLGVSYFHLLLKNQELDISYGSQGDTIYATADSRYNGVNWFLDADPTANLHLFLNSTFERTLYNNWNEGGTDYTGLQVPYVPDTLLNIGAYYTIPVSENVVVQPRIWYQYTGSQTVFDNSVGAPSATTMPTFGTLNLGANLPISWFNVRVTALNVTNKQYNQYLWLSSGGPGSYLGGGTPGYQLAYPGAPFTAFATISARF